MKNRNMLMKVLPVGRWCGACFMTSSYRPSDHLLRITQSLSDDYTFYRVMRCASTPSRP